MELIDHTGSDNDTEDFFFESDHLALRGNPDYCTLLRTITILEAQKIQAIKAIDKLAIIEKEALQNPEEFIKKLLLRKIYLPRRIQIARVPKIDFEKYNINFSQISKLIPSSSKPEDVVIRGRKFDESKPETFNQLWTAEEQRRLEELLLEYPPEHIEMRRFAKIARALGSRTVKQVASRVQKYFKKLHSIGVPIPGRKPKSRPCPVNKNLYKPSTFFPSFDVPINMPEEDTLNINHLLSNDTILKATNPVASTGLNDKIVKNENIKFFVVDKEKEDNEYESDEKLSSEDKHKNRIIQLLQRIRRDKEKETVDRPLSKHIGYSCDLCKENPILGTRWHCLTCTAESIDFCSDCFITQVLSITPHPIFHKFDGLRVSICTKNETENSNMYSFGDEFYNDDDLEDECMSNFETESVENVHEINQL